MTEENRTSCEKCKYYSVGLGEKGYCKLYHHNLTMPERICSRFVQKEKMQTVSHIEENNTRTVPDNAQYKYKYNRRMSYYIGIVCSFILIVALLLIDIVFAVELHLHHISLPVKIGTLFVVMAIFILFAWRTLMFLRKNRWMVVPYMIISLGLVVLVLYDFGNVWISLNNWLNGVIEYIFYDLHV